MGKTSLATNIAYNIAAAYEGEVQADGSMKAKNGGVVGFYSLEMSSEQLATRIISEQTEVSSSKIRRGDINDADFEKLVACSMMMQKVPLYIDQTGGISIAQLSARARRLKRQRGLDVLVVDYIQLMTGSGKSSDNRVQEITQITTGLKALGKELNVPIIALSQLSRQVESRDDKRPQLSDLRESGSIEQDADVVLFVFREEYYVKNMEPRDPADPKYAEWEALFDKVKGTADVIIAKQRHGPTGTVKLAFQSEFTRFADLADPSFISVRRALRRAASRTRSSTASARKSDSIFGSRCCRFKEIERLCASIRTHGALVARGSRPIGFPAGDPCAPHRRCGAFRPLDQHDIGPLADFNHAAIVQARKRAPDCPTREARAHGAVRLHRPAAAPGRATSPDNNSPRRECRRGPRGSCRLHRSKRCGCRRGSRSARRKR